MRATLKDTHPLDSTRSAGRSALFSDGIPVPDVEVAHGDEVAGRLAHAGNSMISDFELRW